MGIVIRKSLITSILSYLGIIIGYLNILYFFPKFLSRDQIGLYRLILNSAILLTPFAQAGIMQGIIRFYPVFNKQDKAKDFTFFVFLFSITSIALVSGLLLFFQDAILDFLFSENIDQIREFYPLLIYLVILMSFIAVFEGFERAKLRIILINFLKDVYIRLLTAITIFLYFQQILDFNGLLYSLLFIYGSAALILGINLFRKHQISLHIPLKISFRELTEVLRYNFFMVISVGSSLVVGTIDSLMVSAYLGLTENGIYTTLFFVAVVIEIPKRAISQLAYSLYAKSFAANKLQEIRILYGKTALNQLIIGLLLYIGIVANLHNLFAFIPNGEDYIAGKWVIIIIGASKVIDMAAGANGELIVMSKHYKFNVYLIALLAGLTIISNILLIPILGLSGAALATLLSLVCFNGAKLLFIYKKFGMQPFSWQTMISLVIGILSLLVGLYLPVIDHNLADLFIRSVIVAVLYSGLILFTGVSPDINQFVGETWTRIRKK